MLSYILMKGNTDLIVGFDAEEMMECCGSVTAEVKGLVLHSLRCTVVFRLEY